MDLDPVFLSRLQFAFVISFHIIFPAFTIGLGAWLATIEGARLVTGNAIYRRVFDFWLGRASDPSPQAAIRSESDLIELLPPSADAMSASPQGTDVVSAAGDVCKVPPDPDIFSFVQLAHRKWLEHWPKVQLA